jgi:hypothetical protein
MIHLASNTQPHIYLKTTYNLFEILRKLSHLSYFNSSLYELDSELNFWEICVLFSFILFAYHLIQNWTHEEKSSIILNIVPTYYGEDIT